MITNSIIDSCNSHWTLLSKDELTGLLRSMIDGKKIIAIHSERRHAISYTSCYNTIASILIIDWSRNGIHVISAVE